MSTTQSLSVEKSRREAVVVVVVAAAATLDLLEQRQRRNKRRHHLFDCRPRRPRVKQNANTNKHNNKDAVVAARTIIFSPSYMSSSCCP
mmetsp:Transcript_19294/g.24897  ORF Transcript_19294/g.24897 Transcript_19294/m.24897 type:complete len:89 (+) Transcript_19294:774-1040(+)